MDKESINTQIAIIVQVVRCIHIKQVLSELDPKPTLNFWRLIHGGFLDLSALDWCKIFGADAEPTHWKGVIDDKDTFREELLKACSIAKEEWEQYWNHMHDYRNQLVAHYTNDSDVSKYPKLDIALNSSHFYYDYLAKLLNDNKVEGLEPLQEYSDKFRAQVSEISETAIKATSEFKENVF